MLCLCLLLFGIVAASRTEPKCTSLGVIRYSEWPILEGFSRELTDNAVLVNVGQGFRDGRLTRAVLHDRRYKTYLHVLHPWYNISNGPDDTRELVEISGLSVKDIKLGYDFIVILTDDGSVWTAGRNTMGQLSGDIVDRPTFTKVLGVEAVKEIAASFEHCVVLTVDNELFSWGNGLDGYLGRIPVSGGSNPIPAKISLGQGASLPTSICCSYLACMTLTNETEIFTWGDSTRIGRSGDNRVPGHLQGIPPGETITKVTCGVGHMVVLTASGRLYGWGDSLHGELQRIANYASSATELDIGEKVVRDVVAGWFITIVRTDDDEVYYFGYYDFEEHWYVTQLEGDLYPRDLMANIGREDSYGAVSLEYDNDEISVTGDVTETSATTGITTSVTGITSSATGMTTSTTGTTSSATRITNSTTGFTSSTSGLSAGAAAGLAVGIMMVVLLVAVGSVLWLWWLQPECMQKLRRRQQQDTEMPNIDIYTAIMEEAPSKPLPMPELPGFLKLTRNSRIDFEAEHNEVVRHSSSNSPSNPGPTNQYEQLGDGNTISQYKFEAYGSHRKHYMLMQGNQCDRKSLWESVWQTGAKNIIVFGDDLKRSLFNGGKYVAGAITISTEYTEEFSEYAVHHMNMINKGVRRQAHVYFFLSWEQGSIPGNAAAIVDFREKLRQRDSGAEVELVVGSGNLDRSGTFMAIDYSLHQGAFENKVDVFRYCVHLLSTCHAMRITKEQYGFVYDAVLEHWESRNSTAQVTQFCAGEDMDTTYSRDLFQKIDALRQLLPPDGHGQGDNAFPEKNRTPDIVPADSARPKLRTDIDEMGEYINAAYVNSYRIYHAYIATQAPLTTTVHDVWRLIYDCGARTVVMLNKIDDDGNAPRYWPFTSVNLVVGNLTVRHQEEHTEECGVTSRLFAVTGEHGDERQVRQFQITNWSDHDDTPDSCDALLRILELTRQWTYGQGNTPIVVHCRDGAHKTGLCCAAMFIIDQLQAEQVVDIFHAVRRVQATRPQFITSQEQLAFLYRIMREFIESNQDYVNQ